MKPNVRGLKGNKVPGMASKRLPALKAYSANRAQPEGKMHG